MTENYRRPIAATIAMQLNPVEQSVATEDMQSNGSGNHFAQPRASNMELLRIVAMAMIVGLHYLGSRGGALVALDPADPNYAAAHALESLCIVGVGCFVLVTGYFQVKRTSASLSKVAGILGLMWFYGFLLYALAVAARWIRFDLKELGKVALPFLVHDRWFVETYLLLYLLSPFINTALVRLGRREFRILLLVMFIFFSAWPSVLPGGPVTDNGYGIATFVLLYSVGAYVRLWGLAPRPKRLYLAGYLLCASATFACSVSLTDTLGRDRIWGYNFVPNLLGSACLFMMFDGIRLQRQYINQIAAHTFAVFLIHTDHSLSGIIYEDVLRTATFRSSPLFLVHAAASIALIYVGATGADVMRKILASAIARRLAPLTGSWTPSRWQGIP